MEREYTLTFTESEIDAITCALQTGMVQASYGGNEDIWERFNDVFLKILRQVNH
jgi:hypothetical protein